MKLVLAKHIHSCFAAVATGDVWLYRVIDGLTEKTIKKHIPSKYEQREDDEVAQIVTVYLEADKTFYNRGLHSKGLPHFAGTPDFVALVDDYKNAGWTDEPADIKLAREAQSAREHVIEVADRKKAGYVFPDFQNKEYSGGFSEKLLSVPALANYIKHGVVFGYIGHYGRKFVTDTFLEEEFMSLKVPKGVNKYNILVSWLTSTDGRHFGDSLEDLTDDAAKARIKSYLPEIFNLGFIYSRKEHNGTWAGTEAMRAKYAKKLMSVGE